jgi:hypothetical protein
MLLPLALCAGRMHFQTPQTPGAVTQEVNRCLTMVRVAATRRRSNVAATGRTKTAAIASPSSPESLVANP